MKFAFSVCLLMIGHFGWTQPDPSESYPSRIKAITRQLEADSLNYALIWERLELKVRLMGSFPPTDELFSIHIDSTKTFNKRPFFDELNNDFIKIYDAAIKTNKTEIVEEGDYYLSRIWFYFNTMEYDKAIADAEYLRDSASYSQYSGRGDYYNDWALLSLYNLNIVTHNFEEALKAMNTQIEKQKKSNPKIHYSEAGSFLQYPHKVRLLEHFNQQEDLIDYLQQACLENFQWYFKKAKDKDLKLEEMILDDGEYYTSKSSFYYYTGSAKEQSFHLLKLLISYMQEYEDDQLPKYDDLYQTIRFQKNEYYETIHPDIKDRYLEEMVLEVFH